jgi:YlmC/YmxH family sporulation protein
MISTQDIRDKELINIYDGKSLGYVSDVEINLEKGRIEALIVPAQSGFFSLFSRENEYIIKWKDIKKIGEDVILVEVKNIYYSEEENGEYDVEDDLK